MNNHDGTEKVLIFFSESIMGRRKTIKSSVTSLSMTREEIDCRIQTPHHQKSKEEALRLSQALRSQYLFDHLQEDQLAMVVDACFPMSITAGEVIVEEVTLSVTSRKGGF